MAEFVRALGWEGQHLGRALEARLDRHARRRSYLVVGGATLLGDPLRGRLMVGRLTLDQEVGVRIPAPQLRKNPAIARRCRFDGVVGFDSCDPIMTQTFGPAAPEL